MMFSAGDSEAPLSIAITDDNVAESLELFIAVVSEPDASGNCALLVTISDNDGKYQFAIIQNT